MDAIFVLLPLSLLFAAVAVSLFVWAVRRGQFDDLETPAVRMLFDDEPGKGTSAGTSAGASTSTSTGASAGASTSAGAGTGTVGVPRGDAEP